eukprot:CAMPEP_0172670714 /NCGR_PEP_ID=MMETSP1074-20121228/10465_1 /TAXON_ID=2916 /ORGANISM="Ceratium fusus, Strain PA161109" /LENGTH=275 /DNA_ID=CAMNT_0013487659 /DNA_START=80 /DNA_END=904 /DNA_ORIENTATION=+
MACQIMPEEYRLFNFEYPANVAVRNTFLEVSLKDDQVQRFFEKMRRAQSCPGGAFHREGPRGWLPPVADEPEPVERQLTLPAAPTEGAAAGVVGAVTVINGSNNAYGIEHGGFVVQPEVVEDMLPFMQQVEPKVSVPFIDTRYCSISTNGHLPQMESNTRFSPADDWWVQEEHLVEVRNEVRQDTTQGVASPAPSSTRTRGACKELSAGSATDVSLVRRSAAEGRSGKGFGKGENSDGLLNSSCSNGVGFDQLLSALTAMTEAATMAAGCQLLAA